MSDPAKRVGKLHKMSKAGEQIRIPCRYCSKLTEFSKQLIEDLIELAANTIGKRGERPIQNNEVAVCPECRHRYAADFNPDTKTINVKAAEDDPF